MSDTDQDSVVLLPPKRRKIDPQFRRRSTRTKNAKKPIGSTLRRSERIANLNTIVVSSDSESESNSDNDVTFIENVEFSQNDNVPVQSTRASADVDAAGSSSSIEYGRKRRASADNHSTSQSHSNEEPNSKKKKLSNPIASTSADADLMDNLLASNTATATATATATDTNDDDAQKCPICLDLFRDQEVGTPNSCEHTFCAVCIERWSQNANTCPIDRTPFDQVQIRSQLNDGVFLRDIAVQPRTPTWLQNLIHGMHPLQSIVHNVMLCFIDSSLFFFFFIHSVFRVDPDYSLRIMNGIMIELFHHSNADSDTDTDTDYD